MSSETDFPYPYDKLRSVVDSDLKDLLRWRNHPKVRRAMISQHKISLQEHTTWWSRVRDDDTKKWYIYMEKDVPSAVINFVNLDHANKTGWFGFYLCDYSAKASAHRGGLAERVVKTIIEHAFAGMKLHLLLCAVRESNTAAIRLYQKCGFVESSLVLRELDASLIIMELKSQEK